MAGSLLAHLYSRIKGSQEDVATVSLQFIISSSAELNRAFNKLLSDALKTDIDLDTSYSLQSVGENKERPDMSGVDSSGKEVVLCEMKFYAGLTFNQPNEYIERLIKENGKALVFVCPEQRKINLWKEIQDRCVEKGRTLTDENGYRVTVDGIAMAIVTWAEVIETLRRIAASVAVETLPDIAQLDGFCEMMDSTAFIPFREEDFGADVARNFERYYQVIDRVADMLVANKTIYASDWGKKPGFHKDRYTRFIQINEYNIGLNYDRRTWMDKSFPDTPFRFGFVGKNKWEIIADKIRSMPEYLGYSYDFPLYAPFDSQLDDIAESMMNQILEIIKRLDS